MKCLVQSLRGLEANEILTIIIIIIILLFLLMLLVLLFFEACSIVGHDDRDRGRDVKVMMHKAVVMR